MAVRAMFRCNSIEKPYEGSDLRQLSFSAVADGKTPEAERYHRYTPNGELRIGIDNPAASDQFEVGKLYYLDFTPAE